ncbi:pectin acetylesterase-family hydrolase [Breoghania sp.]|uniref:pectin acetylesterase-family hydrolase n=1 Tax=Breoghania sp. TaxID=2065378 RepID=UPI0029C859A3|nr:pectin acetylesterase-family hydrolase [Breoghania sp.]
MKNVRSLLPILLSITILLFVSPALAKHKKPRPFFGPGTTAEWTEIDPEEVYPYFTYLGLTPACSNCPGTSSDKFTFFAKTGQQNDLVIFFQGGGACWDSMNCINAPTYSQELSGTSPEQEGIFDTTNFDNPFKKWGFVFIPYCTGDLHWGANDVEYEDSWFQYGGGKHIIQHRGFVNFQVVLKWLKDNARYPGRIFVTGSSAGSYGATMAFAYIKKAFPWSRVYLLGDAGNGVTSDQFNTEGILNWNVQMPKWIFPDGYQPDTTIAEIYTTLAWWHPFSRLAQYTTAWDGTQVFFYNVMDNIKTPASWQVVDPDTGEIYESTIPVWLYWHQQMIDFAYDTADYTYNYRYYIAAGTDHTILRTPKFYTEEVDGVPFADWVAAMVESPFYGRHGRHYRHGWDSRLWRNVECEDCGDLDILLQTADQ